MTRTLIALGAVVGALVDLAAVFHGVATDARPAPGTAFRDTPADGATGPEMVALAGGSFDMGCVSGIGCQSEELPVRVVRVAAFAMGRHEITFDAYQRFARATGRAVRPDEPGRGRLPAVYVSWQDSGAYAAWLSEQTGERYRLPTEADWEYAARAGTRTPFCTGVCIDTDQANHNPRRAWQDCPSVEVMPSRPVEAGTLSANPWGLHEMHGNAWEWVEDCWHETHQGAPVEGRAWTEGKGGKCKWRVVRGGSWSAPAEFVRSAARDQLVPTAMELTTGFRLARDL